MNRTIEVNSLPQLMEPIKEKACILMIDDNHDFTHSAKLALERTGRYFVCEENDGSKAHQTAKGLQPDLILLDIVMPETDGGEVAARIQSDPALHRIPIVFLTALVTKEEGTSGLRIQGHPFLAKPINLPELIEGIEENLPRAAWGRAWCSGVINLVDDGVQVEVLGLNNSYDDGVATCETCLVDQHESKDLRGDFSVED